MALSLHIPTHPTRFVSGREGLDRIGTSLPVCRGPLWLRQGATVSPVRIKYEP